MAQSDTSNFPR